MQTKVLFGSLLIIAALAQATEALPLPPAVAITYSNQCFGLNSGDLSGLRITLLRGPGKSLWTVTYIRDELPFLASAEYYATSGAISFEGTNGGGPEIHFAGTVDAKELRVSSEGKSVVLRAISNIESKIPFCAEY
jgi:hypothetical protein